MKRSIRIQSLLVCIILTMSCIGVSLPAQANYNPEGPVVVTLGDSYTSGEGIEPFYGQEASVAEKIHDPDWLAHRSQLSWCGQLNLPGLDGALSNYRGTFANGELTDGNWFFLAASGAQIKHLYQSHRKSYKQNVPETTPAGSRTIEISGTEVLPPQMEIFTALKARGRQVDYVIMTLGGNDVGFAEILSAAAGGVLLSLSQAAGSLAGVFGKNRSNNRSLSQFSVPEIIAQIQDTFYKEVRATLKRAYVDIWEATDRKAVLIIAGYPRLFGVEGKALPCSRRDAEAINAAADWINGELQTIVNECMAENAGMEIYFVPIADSFDGHEAYACEDENDEYMNRLILLMAGKEDLDNTAKISMYSMHPNAKGAQAYARCVQRCIDFLIQ